MKQQLKLNAFLDKLVGVGLCPHVDFMIGNITGTFRTGFAVNFPI